MAIVRALAYFFVLAFALIGFLTTVIYIWAMIAVPSEFRSVRIGWQTIIPCIVLSAVFVAYKHKKP
jgi:hypothetical protein